MQQKNRIKFTDIPLGLWLIGFAFLGVGIYFFSFQGFSGNIILLGGIGLVVLLLTWGLTITADRQTRTLTLHYWSLYFLRRTKEIPFTEIATIRVGSMRSMDRPGQQKRSYRIEIVRKDNRIVPFRSMYSGGLVGSMRKQKIVDQLRAFIGLGEAVDESPAGLIRLTNQAAAKEAAIHQQALTGPKKQVQVTNDVHWFLQSVALGGSPVTRWYSPDFKARDGFLFLAQKVVGQSSGGFMAMIGNALIQQLIPMYGFKADDVPGLSRAQMLAPVPPLLDPHFTAYTTTQTESRQILNPWAQHPLADWCQQHPLKQMQSKGGFGQLIVLFSPNGVYLAALGILQPNQVEELTRLGVEMVKTQGVTDPA